MYKRKFKFKSICNFSHLFVNAERVVVKKRGITSQHFVDKDPKGPPVHGLIVSLALNDLGGQVLGGATKSPRPIRDALGEPEVRDLEVSFTIKK